MNRFSTFLKYLFTGMGYGDICFLCILTFIYHLSQCSADCAQHRLRTNPFWPNWYLIHDYAHRPAFKRFFTDPFNRYLLYFLADG